jgi:hypothetical protein
MQIYNTGNLQRISTKEPPGGTPIYKNTITKSYMFPEKPTPLLMPYLDPQGLTEVK